MTGPEHYAEAERLLRIATDEDHLPETMAAAQVHATLALAAAYGMNEQKKSTAESA
jgi:hypothetical protein